MELPRTLSLWRGTAVAITLVVGSGVLVLPGLAVQQVGSAAIYAWILAAWVSLPLLIILSDLGWRYPSAEGLVGYIRPAVAPQVAGAVEVILLGAFALLGAAVLLTGGGYLAAAAGHQTSPMPGASLILVSGTALNSLGTHYSSRFQQLLAGMLVVSLVGISLMALWRHPEVAPLPPLSALPTALPAIPLVFYAYVGWEGMSFLSAEFHQPRRDFPRMMGWSFLLVCGLYLLVSLAVQTRLPMDDPHLASTPVAGLLGGKSVSGFGLGAGLLILANFVSWQWAASRLVFAAAQTGLLPVGLSRLTPKGLPLRAICLTAAIFAGVLGLYQLGWVSLSQLFAGSGACFWLGYVAGVLAYIRLVPQRYARWLGGLTLIGLGGLMVGFLPYLILPAIWGGLYLFSQWLGSKGGHHVASR